MVFSFASAVSKDLQTLFITRFFGGLFGCAPLSNVGGVLADIWPASQRGAALLIWGLAVIVGPLIAPIVGGALVVNLSQTGWRWTEYVCSSWTEMVFCLLTFTEQVTGIILAAILMASVLFIEESFPPVLLARKASKIRLETKNWAVHSKSQELGTSIREMSRKYMIVPLEMLIDPICFFINLYAAFVYAIIYLCVFRSSAQAVAVRN